MYNFNPTQEPSREALKVGDLVAVYGSLRKGRGNHSVLGDSKFVSVDSVQGVLFSLGGFPGLVQQSANLSSYPVVIEIYEITSEQDGYYIDGLEGYSPNRNDNDFYVRSKVTTASGREVFIYYYQEPSEDIAWQEQRNVEHGDWTRHRGL